MDVQPQQGHALAPAPQQGFAGGAAGSITPHEITHGPAFAMLRVDLAPGQVVVAEAGAMVARHQGVGMEVKLNASRSAGFFGLVQAFIIAIIRRIVGGETFFVNHFSAPRGGSVWLAPTMSGQVFHRRLQGEVLTLSTGAFLASSGNVDLTLKFGGLRAIFAREGAFFLEARGNGDLWFTSYGGIEAIDVQGSYLVDNGHLVGFEGGLSFDIRSAGGGAMGFLASGEGLVCEFKGQGRVYVQARNQGSLLQWLTPLVGP
jgi:uncharacterized protein (TIGR00266 family)